MNSTTSVVRRTTAAPGRLDFPRPLAASTGGSLRPRHRFTGLVREEGSRRVLWLPVALAGGIGGYFSLTVEPPVAVGLAMTAAATLAALLVRRHVLPAWLSLLLVAAALGFTAAQLRTWSIATVMLERESWATVTGRVSVVERRPAGWRLTLVDLVSMQAAGIDRTPGAVRIAVAGRRPGSVLEGLRAGDRVRVRASLRPPSPPVAPGAYDFQRDAFFRGIGAVGFAVGPIELLDRAPTGGAASLWGAVDRVRTAVAGRIRNVLPGPAGAVAAAMLVGDRAGIDEPTAETFRETGLAHLLAISGLHMGLVAGTVYASLRFAMAAWPAVALRRPVKKWAAAAALVAAALYLLLAGAPVPTQRAFLMTGLILVAVLLDREAISLHLVAWAAAAVLAIAPETLTGPSFQLSFAAVTALIAAWEAFARSRRRRFHGALGMLRRLVGYVGGVAATSLVASLVTAPVVAHHFQQVPLLGSVANLVAVPLTAFVTMPAGVAALVAMPVGWEGAPLRVMGWGIEATLWAAELAAQGPMTAIGVPALGTGPLVALAIGGLWLGLWRSALRWLGIGCIAAGLLLAAMETPPDALFAADGSLSAVRIPGLGWAVSSATGNRFQRAAWERRWGGEPATGFVAADGLEGAAAPEGFGCDGFGCVLRLRGRLLAMPTSPEAALEDCLRADLIVTAVRLRQGCGRGGASVIDRGALRHGGALAVWMGTDGVRLHTVAENRGLRPWVVPLPATTKGK